MAINNKNKTNKQKRKQTKKKTNKKNKINGETTPIININRFYIFVFVLEFPLYTHTINKKHNTIIKRS